MIQLQRNYRNETSSESDFKQSSIRSYEEYLSLARIPHCEGISARVVNALCARVGHSDLSIDRINNDVSL